MSSLKLHFVDDGMSEGGEYSDRKAFAILQPFLQPDSDLSVEKAALLISDMLPGRTENYYHGGLVGMFGGLVYEIAQ